MEPQELLDQGLELARKGDKLDARKLIARAVQLDPMLKQGWWALAHLLDDPAQRLECLQKVIKLDPADERARAKWEELQMVQPHKQQTPNAGLTPAGKSPAGLGAPSPSGASPRKKASPVRRRLLFVVAAFLIVALGVTLAFVLTGGNLENLIPDRPEGGGVSIPAGPASTLPPSWTATSSSTPVPTATSTATLAGPTPAATPAGHTPTATLPPGYADSAWVLAIDGPQGWRAATWMVELSDGAILAAGPVNAGNTRRSTWVARLTPAGEVSWLRSIPLGSSETFYPDSLAAGLDGRGLLSGTYAQTSGGRTEHDELVLSIAPDGTLDWRVEGYSRMTQIEADGSIVLFTGLGAELWDPGQAPLYDVVLDFGAGYLQPPEFYPAPQLVAGRMLPDSSLFFAGTIEDLVVPGDMIERAGPDAGYTTYWFARFSLDGRLIWKHFYPLDATQQGEMHGVTTQDDSLVILGGKREVYRSADSFGYVPIYTWVRKVEPGGRTSYHLRYLDLSRPEGIATSPDGGLLVHGINYIAEVDAPLAIRQNRIMKLDAGGAVEWARQLPDGQGVNAVLPLSDGTYLLSFGREMSFARLTAGGLLPGCPELPLAEISMRVDNEPAQFDAAANFALTLEDQEVEPDPGVVPVLAWSAGVFQVEEICRSSN